MKVLLTISFFFYCSLLFATNYYVKAGGNNSLSGRTIDSAWATIAKVNSFASFATGDTVKFEGGSTFIGQLIPPRNGVAGRPLVFTSYGTGQATISGFTTLTGWVSVGTNLWEATPSPTLQAACNILTINGVPQQLGRLPNSTFNVYQSIATNQITTTALGSAPQSYVGAEIVMRCNSYLMQRVTITSQSQSGGTTTFTYARTAQAMDNGNAQGVQKGSNNYGFFLQRFVASLDQQGEWFYNRTTNKMRIYSTTNPSLATVKASYIDTLIVLGSRSYITLYNLAIEGAGIYAVYGNVSTTGNLVVKNCSLNNNTRALYFWNCFATSLIKNTVNNSFNDGIMVVNRQSKQITIDTNTVTNTGKLVGNGLFPSNENLNGIVQETDTTRANNFVFIRRNIIRSVGAMAIKFHGTNVRASKNISDSFCINIDDGGGIYTFTNNQSTNNIFYSNRVIDSNFISNAIGAFAGTPRTTPDVAGYYMDDQVNDVYGYHNSIWNIPGNGAQFNNPLNMRFHDNTIYNADYAIAEQTKQYGSVSGNIFTRNILYQKTSSQWNFFHNHPNLTQPPPTVTANQSLQQIARMDTNWITNLKTTGYIYYTPGQVQINLTSWRSSSIGHDIVSVLPATVVNNTNTNYYTNPTDTVRVIRFNGLSKVDPKGITYNNLATVPQWSSLVLIDNGTATPANVFPIANAGADQTITTPTSTATLNGSASSDPDGTIIMYSWVKLSGPTGGTIANPSSSITGVSGLVAGIYQYQLTVTDNSSASATSITRITVNTPPNTPPTANAGADQSITLPTNTTTLLGSGSDPDGTIVGYAWIKISGPSGGTITSPTSASTGITALQAGTYAFQLTVTDNSGGTGSDIMNVVVNPANVPPTADAGTDQAITLPVNSVTLTGVGTDPDGTIASYAWAKISGPSGGAITSPSTASTDITGLQEGTYVYRLTVTDNMGATGVDFVQVLVNPVPPQPNTPPIADAGADKTITLPTNTTTLVGNGVDPDGTMVSYLWVKVSGPSGGTITSPSSATTNITALQQGTYAYKLRVTDNRGDTASDFVQVLVNPIPPNNPPTADAGADQSITLPTNTTTLTGSGTDTDGSIVSYAWAKVSGPAGGTISSPSSATTGITALQQGTYVYRLTVTDNLGLTGVDFVQVLVNPIPPQPNTPPTADAGVDQTINLPTNTTTLTGSGTDADGTIISYAWVKISGPSGGNITNSASATTGITALQQGDYAFRLTVTDNNGGTGVDVVQVTVNPAPVNIPPTANAGEDTTITLPANTVTLIGTATDQDGTIVSYAWTKISGPTGGNITNPSASTTNIISLQEGTYAFKFTVTDNNGGIGFDFVQVIVNAAIPNSPPLANAGNDTTIILPTNSVTLMGSASDTDGVVTAYMWRKISGPSGGDITSPNTATTGITSMIAGDYIFQLRVTDNSGDTATDAVQITVNPANVPPTVNAGSNQTITLPTDTTSINATASDPDGSISSILWTKISGPSGGAIGSSTALSTTITGLLEGVYIYRIKVVDNSGDSAIASIQITVNPVPILTAPTANGGPDQILYVPDSTAILSGSGTNGTGTIISHVWSLFSGPAGGDIETPTNYTTNISNLIEGTYIYKLTVTDNNGLIGTDLIQIIIRPIPVLPKILLKGYKQ